MIYFGANDGMIHAINGGFYNENGHQFCTQLDADYNCESTPGNVPDLGAEMWAYIPYNIAPHLHCLTEPGYKHQYYMDLKPTIFDVKIFDDDTDHPGGWGTILVTGMRFGGASIDSDDARIFKSAYVILDITNPEVPPTLLGELTYDPAAGVEMGFTTGIPAVIPMKDNAGSMEWYLVMGSGPTDIEGQSNQTAKVAVFNLKDLIPGANNAFRIPDSEPFLGQANGRYELSPSANGFVSDIIAVDFDLTENYRADAIYFGTVEGTWGDWKGKLYRWATLADSDRTDPYEWSRPAVMFNPDRPITAAPSIGYDGENYWLYFGTGRFFDKRDQENIGQDYYFGLKEPMECDGSFLWENIDDDYYWDTQIQFLDDLTNVTLPAGVPGVRTELPGGLSLTRTDQINIKNSYSSAGGTLTCDGGGTACLPTDVTNFENLKEHIVGKCSTVNGVDSYTGTDGWYMNFANTGERNLGQATLLGGFVTFTSYQPYADPCIPEGESNLWALYYQTGTSYFTSVFNNNEGIDADGNVVKKIALGRGLALTPNLHVGRKEGAKAFVQTSTGAIVEIEQPNLPIKSSKSGRSSWRCD